MRVTATRLTLYVIISAMEEDLRRAICRNMENRIGTPELLGQGTWETAMERRQEDTGELDEEPSLAQVLNYVDFANLYSILNSHRARLPREEADHIRAATQSLERIVPIRNRVAHSRPLRVDDFAVTLDTARELTASSKMMWSETQQTLTRLERNPSYVLGMRIRVYDSDRVRCKHNLPMPDFDETGFIGRAKDISNLVEHCLGPYPVISILGEGGIGKTATAVKVAYDMLDLSPCPFEAIVWTSSKTTRLTGPEVSKIDNAIRHSLGIFQSAADELAGQGAANALQEVIDYLREFKILLILDNLETVVDDRITYFLEHLSGNSKVIITSRIGLGAFEFPVKLDAMNEDESVQLLRALAKMRGVSDLVKVPNSRVARYCRKMNNNPGFIKWFVSVVQSGKRPEETLANPDVFLEFCLSNVYRNLSDGAKRILKSMQAVPGRHTQAELAFLNEMTAHELQNLLHEVLASNMVTMPSIPKGSSFESQYDLCEMARSYLGRQHALRGNEFKALADRRKELVAKGEQIRAGQKSNPFSFFSINTRSRSDLVVAKYLVDAIDKIKRKEFDEAEGLVLEARQLAPEYYEVHRVEAYLRVEQGNLPAARTAYEAAIELEPTSAPLRFWYGGFLLRHIGIEEAIVHFGEALRISPDTPLIETEMARAYLYSSRFSEAREALDRLLGSAGLPQWTRRKIYDLHLQYYQRQADHLISQHDNFGALENIERLRDAYERCPRELLDRQMGQKLQRVLPTVRLCQRFLLDKEVSTRVLPLLTWLEQQVAFL